MFVKITFGNACHTYIYNVLITVKMDSGFDFLSLNLIFI